MNLTTSSELSQTRYRIAELILEFNHPADYPLAQLLPSFRDFQWLDPTDKTDISITVSVAKAPIPEDMGILRTDESIAWEIDFVFMKKRILSSQQSATNRAMGSGTSK